MNRLKKTLIIFSFLVSALLADVEVCSPLFAQSNEARELNRKGVVALSDGRFSESVQLLKQAMALEPKWGEPCFNAARLLKIMGKREEMTKMLRKANALEPDNITYSDEYLKVLFEDYDKAEKESNSSEMNRLREEVLRVNPGNLKMGLLSVQKLLDSGEKTEASHLAEKILSNNTKLRSKPEIKEMGELFYIVAQIANERGDMEKAKTNAEYASMYNFDQKNEAKDLYKKLRDNLGSKVDNLIAQANSERNSGNHVKAISLLKKAGEIQPDNETIKNSIIEFENEIDANKYLEIAKRFLRDGDWLDARETLVVLLEKYPENSEAEKLLESLAPKVKALSFVLGGISDLPLTFEERKNLLNNYLNIADGYYKGLEFNKAILVYKKALALIKEDRKLSSYKKEIDSRLADIDKTDKNAENWKKATKDYRDSGDYESMLKCLKALPSDYNPDSEGVEETSQLDSFLAEAYFQTGDIEKAEHHALLQLSKDKDNNRAKFIMGKIRYENGEYENAYKYFSEIYTLDSSYPEIGDNYAKAAFFKYLFQAIYIIVLGLLIWIIVVMKKKMPIYKKNSMISKAKSTFKRGDYDDTIKILMDVRHSPILTEADNFEITKLFAQSYLKKGAYDKAIGECKHLISLSPKNEEAHLWLGYAYLGRRMLAPEALPELLNLYKKESRNIALVSLLGSYYAQQKTLTEEGVKILEQWLNLDSDNIEVLKPLGKYYLKKNKTDDKAMKVFKKMMEIGSPDPDFMLGVANVYLKMKQYDNCLQLCEHVINEDINNEYVHSILLEAYKKQNRLSELLDIYANFLQNNPYNVAFQNGLRAAQTAYDKLQAKNASQAANEAAAVMEKMMSSNFDETNSGDVACPSCGNTNPQGAYICQHCGANIV